MRTAEEVKAILDELEDWIASRPPSVRAMIERFPPACAVRAVQGKLLMAPRPGRVGVVVGYSEKFGPDRKPTGEVNVHVRCDGWQGECQPDWIERAREGEA